MGSDGPPYAGWDETGYCMALLSVGITNALVDLLVYLSYGCWLASLVP